LYVRLEPLANLPECNVILSVSAPANGEASEGANSSNTSLTSSKAFVTLVSTVQDKQPSVSDESSGVPNLIPDAYSVDEPVTWYNESNQTFRFEEGECINVLLECPV